MKNFKNVQYFSENFIENVILEILDIEYRTSYQPIKAKSIYYHRLQRSSPSSQSLHTLQPADIMKNDLINPIRLEFQTNQLSFNADQADQIFNRTQPRLTTIEAGKHTPREQYWT